MSVVYCPVLFCVVPSFLCPLLYYPVLSGVRLAISCIVLKILASVVFSCPFLRATQERTKQHKRGQNNLREDKKERGNSRKGRTIEEGRTIQERERQYKKGHTDIALSFLVLPCPLLLSCLFCMSCPLCVCLSFLALLGLLFCLVISSTARPLSYCTAVLRCPVFACIVLSWPLVFSSPPLHRCVLSCVVLYSLVLFCPILNHPTSSPENAFSSAVRFAIDFSTDPSLQ